MADAAPAPEAEAAPLESWEEMCTALDGDDAAEPEDGSDAAATAPKGESTKAATAKEDGDAAASFLDDERAKPKPTTGVPVVVGGGRNNGAKMLVKKKKAAVVGGVTIRGVGAAATTAALLAGAAAAEDAVPVDAVLLDAVKDPRSRRTVLKYEDALVRFVENRGSSATGAAAATEKTFENLSSFHRLLLHRLAARFKLEHEAVGGSAVYDARLPQSEQAKQQMGIVVRRTPATRVPATLFVDTEGQGPGGAAAERVVAGEANPFGNKKVKMMTRKGGRNRGGVMHDRRGINGGSGAGSGADSDGAAGAGGGGGGGKANLTSEDRDRAYEERKARLLAQMSGGGGSSGGGGASASF